MIVICKHCEARAKIPADNISGCGFPMAWQCSNCDCVTYITKRNGRITTRFESTSAIYARMNPTPLQTIPMVFDADACPDKFFESEDSVDEWFGECFDQIFGPLAEGEMSGGQMLIAAMKRTVQKGMTESFCNLIEFENMQFGTGLQYKNMVQPWKWSAYFDEVMQHGTGLRYKDGMIHGWDLGTDQGLLSLINQATQ